MGKKTKMGKGRLDKYYNMAKQQGYRSRASFKLIQINKKYNILQKANVVVDLCAAPGGWLQVCEKFCPIGSIKIGLDLDKIPPIPGCKSFQQDITTPECVALLKKELQGKKADAFLNDGAPNVGSNWSKDAFQQIELTLSALKLACTFLRKGGSFITKVFRSTDYNALVYVMKKFFTKVEANKPLASRFTSAEIFVCCMDFIAPDFIDDKLFDPKYIFKDTETDMQIQQQQHEINSIDKIMEKRRKRQGYEDNAPMMLHKKMTFEEFIKVENPFAVFVTHSQIGLPSQEFLDIYDPPQFYDEYLEDIKVLGKREIAVLLKYRGKLRQKLSQMKHKILQRNRDEEPDIIGEEDEEEEDIQNEDQEQEQDIEEEEEDGQEVVDSEGDIENEDEDWEDEDKDGEEKEEDEDVIQDDVQTDQIRKLQQKELNAQRKAKAKKDKQISKQGITAEFGGDFEDQELFSLKAHKSLKKLGYIEVDEENGEPKVKKVKMSQKDIEQNLEDIYERSQNKVGKNQNKLLSEDVNFDEDKLGCEGLDDKPRTKKEQKQLIKELAKKSWFGQDVFQGVGGIEQNNDMEEEEFQNPLGVKKFTKIIQDDIEDSDDGLSSAESHADDYESDIEDHVMIEEQNQDKDFKKQQNDIQRQENRIDPDEEMPGELKDDKAYILDVPQSEMAKRRKKLKRQQKRQDLKKAKESEVNEMNIPIEVVPETKIEDYDVESLAETLAMAKKMLRKRNREEIIDSSYSRYAQEDHDELPTWFVDDEKKHSFKHLPITKEETKAELERIKSINAQAPKKVIEAKIRKQKRLEKKMKKANKIANEIFEQEGVSEKMKIEQAKKLYAKKKAEVTKDKKKGTVVARKFKSGKVNQKSKTTSYVDPRMRKDVKNTRKQKAKRGEVQSGNGGRRPSRKRQVKRHKKRA